MIQQIRHYFKRRQAIKLFADRFLFEPTPSPAVQPPVPAFTPSPQPQTTTVLPVWPQPTNTPPVMPQPIEQPQTFAAPVVPAPTEAERIMQAKPNVQQEISSVLEPMAAAKMDVINRRLQ